MRQRNINTIVERDFCICCGTCEQVCPHHAITSVYKDGMFLPSIDETLCTDCGICQSVCPSHEIDVTQTYPKLDFEEESFPSYTIWTKDGEIRKLSTSGGAISTMIVTLLEAKQYDKAYVLEYESFNGEKAVLSPVTTREGVLSAAKSKYIPASVVRVIADIKNKSIGRAIIVATPCQLLAIKRCLALRKMSDADLLFFGLFCDKIEKYSIYSHFEDKYGSFQSLHFRDKAISGWPGNVLITQNGRSVDISREERMAVKEKFQMNRCRYCFDKLNMLADISFGDCYVAGCDDKLGRSSIVVRTKKGENVFDFLKDKFYYYPVLFDTIKKSQVVECKKENLFRNQGTPNVYKNIYVQNNHKSCTQMKYLMKIKRILKRLICGRRWPLVIFIDNVGFVNKGAELMLRSIVEQIRVERPDSIIVVHRHVFYQNVSYCVKNNIYPLQVTRKGLKGIRYNIAVNLLLNKTWLVTSDKVDVILDAAGLHLTDQYIKSDMLDVCGKTSYVDYLKEYYSQFSKSTRKLILLPQAFGPYHNDASKEAMLYMYEQANMIFPREQQSYDYLSEILPSIKKVKTYSDFTCLLHENNSSPIHLSQKDYILIIPNSRMIDRTTKEISECYRQFLCRITEFLIDSRENVYLLNHAGKDDENLLQDLNKSLSCPLPIITNLSGVEIKDLIANAKLVISSRFHGVVSSLTQGVPTLCTSWSHKYQELLREHECTDSLLDVLNVEGTIETINDALKNPTKYSSKDGCIDQLECNVRKMWKEIFEMI